MIAAILQARMTSTRFPGKVLAPILGKPMLARQIERIQRARLVDRLVLATSISPQDDPIETLSSELNLGCFRGSLDDVLDRYYQAASVARAETVVRLTGDCPLCDPAILDQTISFFLNGSYDYVSSSLEPTFPDGLDVEVFSFKTLERAAREAVLPSEREHVTHFIINRPERFRLGSFKQSVDQSHLRWTVDTPEDLEVVRSVYTELYPRNAAFTTAEIFSFLDRHPELAALNANHQRNEGWQSAFEKDQIWLSGKK